MTDHMTDKSSPPPPYYPTSASQGGYPDQTYPSQQYPPQSYPSSQPQPNYGQQQPNYGYPQQPQVQTATVVVTHSQGVLGSHPCLYFCPKCQENVMTNCTYDSSSLAWMICIGLFVAGFCFIIPWFICWIPFCLDGMRNAVHRCSKCSTYLGTYKSAGI